jgi:hypothetical protein
VLSKIMSALLMCISLTATKTMLSGSIPAV